MIKMKRTKIVATIGPSSSSKEVLRNMINSGMNVCRVNFSHGAYEDHEKVVKVIRELNDELNTNVAILADLQGPKIRTGLMQEGGVHLEVGAKVLVQTDDILGKEGMFSINYNRLPADVKKGEFILLDDGKLMLEVEHTDGKKQITCKVIQGGILSSRKGVNFPNTRISMPSLTEKDILDLQFAIDQDVDWIGLSFVRSARDIIDLKQRISKAGGKAKVIAKIEKPEALECIDDIISETDGLMVARGDLGVEIPYQKVPLTQKMLINKGIQYAKPVIVATQMMESMITQMSPTRAEVNDVANAVLDGADAVMLSGETSVGNYPVEVINAMAKIIKEMESDKTIYYKEEPPEKNQERFISDSICYNACRLAQRVEVNAIITMSFSGYTAYKIASQRPSACIYIFTSNRKILTQLNLVWGVKAFYYNKQISTDHTIADIKYIMKSSGHLVKGDLIINIASIPLEDLGSSNMLKLSHVD
ncbi:MAG: pyruvate kinase [Crocinitomicaceae bacterium]|tara:strand:- start:5152 stop:6579 length:1428 start_codon:yes stop_codon:yes gene_type:complete